jgi:hypothetical protein
MPFKQPFRMFYEMARLLAQGFSKSGCNRDFITRPQHKLGNTKADILKIIGEA